MTTRWLDPHPVDVPVSFADLNLPPLIEQTLVRRGITTPEAAHAFLDPDSQPLASPYELPGMQAAAQRIHLAIRSDEKICVWGDFDVDGQTSTTVLVQTLRAIGADVSYYIPIRGKESHGVHIESLAPILERGVKLILTCDTGITAHEAVEYAKSRGVDMVITDHHDPLLIERRARDSEARSRDELNLPNAAAVVNPKLLPENHSLANLAGVGVAYKLAEALLENRESGIGNRGTSSDSRITTPESLLDLVALGLIADVALLRGETRTLAQKGLDVLRNSERLGLKLIAELANQPLSQATEEYIGFVLAPRLNALGRLGDANPAVELLTTDDPVRARVLAAQLEGLNSQRKLLTNQVYQAAEAQLRADPSLLTQPAIVLGHPAWPGGVVGIVASRLKERYNKPVILFNTPDDGPARGSARSIEGLHITEAIAAQSDLLLGFGGHPMAAGLSLEQENLPAFRKGLVKTIEKMLGEAALEEPSLQIDAWMALDELRLELADSIEHLAPFGAGNPPLTFASRNLSLKSVQTIGRGSEHVRLNVEDEGGDSQSILWWNGANEEQPEGKFDLAYSLRASTYRGERQLTLEFVDFRVVEEKVVEVKRKKVEVIDLRHTKKPLEELSAVYRLRSTVIFAEGDDKKKTNGIDRFNLEKSAELAIYNTPPGPAELKAILEQVKPQKVYLIAHNPPVEKTDEFLTRLAGMAKFVIAKKSGETTISALAAATAQREATIRIGLEWLSAGGHVAVSGENDTVLLSAGSGEGQQYVQKELYIAVKGLLEETVAYRNYVATTKDPKGLIDL
jgi:single-stranded-DNA-specific exonuclease